MSINADWLTLISGGGNLYDLGDNQYFSTAPGSATLGFTAEANTTSSSRTATITLSAGDITNNVLVTQAGISLSVSTTSVSVATAGESFTVTVTCDTDYSVDVSDTWLTLESDNAGTLAFTAEANSSGDSRTATITVTAGDLSSTVEVTQAGISLSVSPTSVSVAAAGESFTVTVTCDTDYSVDISDDWLTMNSNSSGTLSFTADANTSGSSRTATITITAGDLSETVTVTQAGISLSVSPTTVSVAAAGESFTVSVTCDTDYSVEVSEDWLSLESDNAGTLAFTAEANTSGSSRTATITITAGELSVIVTVTQEGADDSEDDSSGDDSGSGDDDPSGTINGYEYVDLGLSVKWATCNIGADSPEEYGNYYAWGETETKETYTSDNSVTHEVSGMSDFSGNAEYDAATANWGSPWRMPTDSEITELRTSCTWTWTTLNDVNGCEVTGTNSNSIFLPVAGCRTGSSLGTAGITGYYWSSTSDTWSTVGAYRLNFNSSSVSRGIDIRYRGQSVRPVSD